MAMRTWLGLNVEPECPTIYSNKRSSFTESWENFRKILLHFIQVVERLCMSVCHPLALKGGSLRLRYNFCLTVKISCYWLWSVGILKKRFPGYFVFFIESAPFMSHNNIDADRQMDGHYAGS